MEYSLSTSAFSASKVFKCCAIALASASSIIPSLNVVLIVFWKLFNEFFTSAIFLSKSSGAGLQSVGLVPISILTLVNVIPIVSLAWNLTNNSKVLYEASIFFRLA